MAYDLSNVRVLIVDPSPFRRTLFCDVLKAIGIEKFEALGDGTTAYSSSDPVAVRDTIVVRGRECECSSRTDSAN